MKNYLVTFKTNSMVVINCENYVEKDLVGDGNIIIFFKLNNITIGNVRKSDILSIEEF